MALILGEGNVVPTPITVCEIKYMKPNLIFFYIPSCRYSQSLEMIWDILTEDTQLSQIVDMKKVAWDMNNMRSIYPFVNAVPLFLLEAGVGTNPNTQNSESVGLLYREARITGDTIKEFVLSNIESNPLFRD